MKAQRLMSRVRENADLLKLLLDLAFWFCGLLKQVNTAFDKTIGAIFAHFSVSVILFSGWPKILILVLACFWTLILAGLCECKYIKTSKARATCNKFYLPYPR